MDVVRQQNKTDDDGNQIAAGLTDAAPAWQLIEAGRYQPRRIRGSCRGRELG